MKKTHEQLLGQTHRSSYKGDAHLKVKVDESENYKQSPSNLWARMTGNFNFSASVVYFFYTNKNIKEI